MVVILFQTMTFFPAIVTALIGQDALRRVRAGVRIHISPPAIVARHPGAVVVVSLLFGVGAVALLPKLRFDANVVNMRDDRTESVQTFKDLLAASDTSPWYIDVLTPSLAEAQERARRLHELDVVEMTLTLADFVPADQEEKIEVLADAALLLDTPSAPASEPAQVSTQDQIAALRALHEQLGAEWLAEAKAPLAGSARRLRDELQHFLDRLEAKDDPTKALHDLERILLGNFSGQLDRLRRALEPSPITLESLPEEITIRMIATDGHARIQVFPREDLSTTGTLTHYVDAVRSLEPDATGVAPNILEFGRATTRSLRQALLSAAVAITLLVFLLWRRWVDTVLVMSPVLLAAAMTAGTMVLLGIRFDFTNVVVLPLLLGIGVDSGIHLVHRAGEAATDDLLETTTARAVFFSALTTVASFGSLSFSGHRGISSMGKLLVSGMLLNLACNLIFLPALLALRKNRESGKSGESMSGVDSR
jgi:hopanoid biosynthesis associated RND transporter like protein HpnN